MPRKCCIPGCKSNYDSQSSTVKIFTFPSNPDEREKWKNALPIQMDVISNNMGICQKHWSDDVPMQKKRRFETPKVPPSIFPGIPKSCLMQSNSGSSRSCKERQLLAVDRNSIPDEMDAFRKLDALPLWPQFLTDICSSDIITDNFLVVSKLEENLYLCAFSKTGDVAVRIFICPNFSVQCFHYHTPVAVRDLLGFQPILKTWSQLREVINRCKNAVVSVDAELAGLTAALMNVLKDEGVEILNPATKFLLSQLQLLQCSPMSRRYDIDIIRQCALIYLISSSAYIQLRSLLPLPHERTLRTQLAGLGEIGTEADCEETIRNHFRQLSGCQLLCALTFDEMYVKPSLRYRSRHIIGHALDKKDKMARTILAIMLKPLMGGKPFILRLLPIYSLTPTFLLQHLSHCIQVVNRHGGQIIALISDNHPTNRKCFSLFSQNAQSKPWIGKDENQVDNFFLLNDTVHLLKCIRNNWQSEINGEILFHLPGEGETTLCAKWSDIVQLYRLEEDNLVRRTRLTYEACFPSNIQKLNVYLVLQVFDEKVAAALKCEGKSHTAVFIENILKYWKIVNCKNPELSVQMNDADRCPIASPADERLQFLSNLANSFSQTGGGRGNARLRSLTSETSTALVNTLHGIVDLCKELLTKFSFTYVLLAEFQTDYLEAEFGVYRQMSGANYFVSVEQVLLSARLRRMKLYTLLETEEHYQHQTALCCSTELSDDELSTLDNCCATLDDISSSEKTALYYIAGYITHMEGIHSDGIDDTGINVDSNTSEFTEMVSRGKLKYPPRWLFHFTCLCYCCFRLLNPTCANRVSQLFQAIADYYIPHIEVNLEKASIRLCNCLFKGLVRKETKVLPANSTLLEERKLKKLSHH